MLQGVFFKCPNSYFVSRKPCCSQDRKDLFDNVLTPKLDYVAKWEIFPTKHTDMLTMKIYYKHIPSKQYAWIWQKFIKLQELFLVSKSLFNFIYGIFFSFVNMIITTNNIDRVHYEFWLLKPVILFGINMFNTLKINTNKVCLYKN